MHVLVWVVVVVVVVVSVSVSWIVFAARLFMRANEWVKAHVLACIHVCVCVCCHRPPLPEIAAARSAAAEP